MRTIIGHDALREQLKRMAGLPEVPQSFLFAGPRHLGKQLVAQWFARELIGGDTSREWVSDLLLLEPERMVAPTTKRMKEKMIPVEAVRSIKRFLSLSPTEGKRRVIIIDHAEKLGRGASEALLKIIEEPPARSVIILCAAEPESLAPTLLSRLVPVYFRPMAAADLRQQVPAAQDLPQFFFDLGLPGLVVEALEQPEAFAAKKDLLRSLFQLSKLSWRERLRVAELLAKDESMARDILEVLMTGLVFQARQGTGTQAFERYYLIERILFALQQLTRGEGAGRPIFEKLLLSV